MTSQQTKPIVMTFMQPMDVRKVLTCAYEFHFSRRWKWIERPLMRLLRPCLKPYFDEKQVFKQVVIDPEQAAAKIIELAHDQLRRSIPPQQIKRILVGRPQFDQIARGANMYSSPFTFNISLRGYRERTGPYDSGVTWYTIPIEVIPWMDGVLVL